MQREDKLFLLCILCMQTSVWMKHLRQSDMLSKKPAQLIKAAQLRIEDFLNYTYDKSHQDERDQTYEISVNISELIEDIVQLPDEDIGRVRDLVNQIIKEQNLITIQHEQNSRTSKEA